MLGQVSIPEGKVGTAEVRHFDVRPDVEAWRLAAAGRPVSPGRYTKLLINGRLVMSDTPAEVRDHSSAYYYAKGDVLITGLGLGMIAAACARKPGVETVTVVEVNPDVVALVAPHLPSNCTVVEADAFAWAPPKGARYGAVWHDIWPDLCTDNLSEMTTLKRKYARRADWQGCWGEGMLRRRARQERREERRWAAWR